MTARDVGPLVPSTESVHLFRITGALMAAVALGLIAAAGDLSWRDRVPALLLWTQFLVPVGLLGVAVGFITIRPASGGLRRRLGQQSATYKTASTVTALALVAVLAPIVAYIS